MVGAARELQVRPDLPDGGGADDAEGAALNGIGEVVFGLLGTVLLWALVVGAFCAVVMVMTWLTSRIFRLTGRRRD